MTFPVGFLLVLFALLSDQAAEEKKASDSAQRLIAMHEAWGAKASTPNMSLEVKQDWLRSGSHANQLVVFRLYAKGLPKGIYSIVQWPVTRNSPSEMLRGVTLDESGLAICAGTPRTCGSPDKPNDAIDLPFSPVPGEPVRLGLVSADGATKVFAKLVPRPLRGEDHGCSVEATLLTPAAEIILIEGSGFPPNSDLVLDSNSEGERHSGPGKVGPDGSYVSGVLPYKAGVKFGKVQVNLKSAKCSPSVEIPWGRRDSR
jgi:hypothetical protein